MGLRHQGRCKGAPPSGEFLLVLESVGRKEVTFHGGGRAESGPLPRHFCFLCTCCPQGSLGGNSGPMSWEPNCARPGLALTRSPLLSWGRWESCWVVCRVCFPL